MGGAVLTGVVLVGARRMRRTVLAILTLAIAASYGPQVLAESALPEKITPVPSTTYKFVFDANSQVGEDGQDSSLREVAAFQAMYEAAGVPAENLRFVIVLHGARTQTALNSQSYGAAHGGNDNPNIGMVNALLKKRVRIVVAEPSLPDAERKADTLLPGVESGPISNIVFLDLENSGYVYTGTRNLSTE